MDAIELRTTCAPTDCGVIVPSNTTVTARPILSGRPHSARRPLVEMFTSVALKPGGEIRSPVIDGTADAGRRGAGECPPWCDGPGRAAAGVAASTCGGAVGPEGCEEGTVATYKSSGGEGGVSGGSCSGSPSA